MKSLGLHWIKLNHVDICIHKYKNYINILSIAQYNSHLLSMVQVRNSYHLPCWPLNLRRKPKNAMHFNGLPQHPYGNTMSIDIPLPHLEAWVRQIGKAKSAILSLDDLTAGKVEIIVDGWPNDQNQTQLFQIKLNYAIPHTRPKQPVKCIANKCASPTITERR